MVCKVLDFLRLPLVESDNPLGQGLVLFGVARNVPNVVIAHSSVHKQRLAVSEPETCLLEKPQHELLVVFFGRVDLIPVRLHHIVIRRLLPRHHFQFPLPPLKRAVRPQGMLEHPLQSVGGRVCRACFAILCESFHRSDAFVRWDPVWKTLVICDLVTGQRRLTELSCHPELVAVSVSDDEVDPVLISFAEIEEEKNNADVSDSFVLTVSPETKLGVAGLVHKLQPLLLIVSIVEGDNLPTLMLLELDHLADVAILDEILEVTLQIADE
mmetsp:Transcript_54923/g.128436  ORF Transcript_54923/g.128436 Transcript_54923/m.128436 type:complete len:269 (-) Transcript_54923:71-877(-)